MKHNLWLESLPQYWKKRKQIELYPHFCSKATQICTKWKSHLHPLLCGFKCLHIPGVQKWEVACPKYCQSFHPRLFLLSTITVPAMEKQIKNCTLCFLPSLEVTGQKMNWCAVWSCLHRSKALYLFWATSVCASRVNYFGFPQSQLCSLWWNTNTWEPVRG